MSRSRVDHPIAIPFTTLNSSYFVPSFGQEWPNRDGTICASQIPTPLQHGVIFWLEEAGYWYFQHAVYVFVVPPVGLYHMQALTELATITCDIDARTLPVAEK